MLKRPFSSCIDLTLDDDDAPPRQTGLQSQRRTNATGVSGGAPMAQPGTLDDDVVILDDEQPARKRQATDAANGTGGDLGDEDLVITGDVGEVRHSTRQRTYKPCF